MLNVEFSTMIKCNHCNDRKIIKQGSKPVTCPYCVTEERLVVAIKRAIEDSVKANRKEFAKKLEKVLYFLPESPVMAVLEAEALDLPENFVIMIRDSFDIRPFGDRTYKNF